MTRSNRLIVLLVAAVLLPILGYVAVPMIYLSYMIFFGPGLACGDICDRPDWVAPANAIIIAAAAVYVLVMALGVWWVMKGEPD